jgi:chemotaxis protein histidine kinase CheA
MAEDQLRTSIDGLRTRIQAELDAHLDAVAQTHAQTLEEARRAADAEAEQRWEPKLEAQQAEWTARLQAEVAAARTEVERTMVAEITRVRVEAAQAAAEAAARARHDADAEAEQRWAPKVEAVRVELAARIESEVAAARSETERRMVAESMRVRVEAEQAAAEAAAHARRELEQALLLEREGLQGDFEDERQRAQQALEAERRRTQTEVEAERQQAQAQVASERQRAEGELTRARAAFEAEHASAMEAARASSIPAAPAALTAPAINTTGLLDAIRAIDDAGSLSDALAASVRGAALEAPRAALFIVNGTELQEWPVPGIPTVHAGTMSVDAREAGVLGDALRQQEPVTSNGNGGPSAPAFASLPPGRVALAVPLMLGGRPVAVLYADEGADGQAPPAWQELVQILGRHASAYVAYLTAVRTAEAMRLMSGADVPAAEQGREPEQDEAQGARRYARLLVSEIKLYNEGQVRMGRERRDLLSRLKPEIDRARRLYDERVAPSIHSRDAYFQQELVQTLADGDQSLLG